MCISEESEYIFLVILCVFHDPCAPVRKENLKSFSDLRFIGFIKSCYTLYFPRHAHPVKKLRKKHTDSENDGAQN